LRFSKPFLRRRRKSESGALRGSYWPGGRRNTCTGSWTMREGGGAEEYWGCGAAAGAGGGTKAVGRGAAGTGGVAVAVAGRWLKYWTPTIASAAAANAVLTM
jgi:hypothetical protein